MIATKSASLLACHCAVPSAKTVSWRFIFESEDSKWWSDNFILLSKRPGGFWFTVEANANSFPITYSYAMEKEVLPRRSVDRPHNLIVKSSIKIRPCTGRDLDAI